MSDQATITDSTKHAAKPAAAESLAPQLQEGKPTSSDSGAANRKLVSANILPNIHIDATPPNTNRVAHAPAAVANEAAPPPTPQVSKPASHGFFDDVVAAGSDLLKGAWNEVTQHPGKIAEDAVVGAATGVALVGLAAIAPEVATGVAIVGVGAAVVGGAYELAKHGEQWIQDAKTVGNPESSSKTVVAKAHADLQNLGAKGADGAVMIGSGMVAGGLTGIAIKAATAGAGAAADFVPTGGYANLVTPGGSADLATTAGSTAPESEAGAAVANSEAVIADAAPKVVPLTAENSTLITRNPEAADLWSKVIKVNENAPMGAATNRFANDWATLMQDRMAAGEPLTAELADQTANQADTEGISGSMYQRGRNLLYEVWQHGAQLKELLGEGF